MCVSVCVRPFKVPKNKAQTVAQEQHLAEREGFEPPMGLHPCRISSAVHSTTLPPLRRGAEAASRSARGRGHLARGHRANKRRKIDFAAAFAHKPADVRAARNTRWRRSMTLLAPNCPPARVAAVRVGVTTRETDLPALQDRPQAAPRFPRPHGDRRRPQGHRRPSRPRSQAAVRLNQTPRRRSASAGVRT